MKAILKEDPVFKIVSAAGVFAALIALVLIIPRSRASSSAPLREARHVLYAAPTPTPIEVLWVDSAGNLGMRGVEAVVPGKPDEKAKLSDACRASAQRNGEGTLTICVLPDVGRTIIQSLGRLD